MQIYAHERETLQKEFGQLSLIVSTQLSKIENFHLSQYNDSSALIDFINVITAFGSNFLAVALP